MIFCPIKNKIRDDNMNCIISQRCKTCVESIKIYTNDEIKKMLEAENIDYLEEKKFGYTIINIITKDG